MEAVKQTVKSTGYRFLVLMIRLLTGFFLGLTLSFIAQELVHFGMTSLILITTVITASFLKISSQWTITRILIFDLICILVGQILKMYILLAP